MYINYFGNIAKASEQLIEADYDDEAYFNPDLARYGFIIEAGLSRNSMRQSFEMEILDDKNSFTIFETKKTKILFGRMESGEYVVDRVSPKDIYVYMTDNDVVTRQTIKYILSEDGYLDELYLIDETSLDSKYFSRKEKNTGKYYGYNTIQNKYYCDENTVVLHVPGVGSDESLMRSGRVSDFFSHDTSYNMELWDVKSDGYVPCIVYITTVSKTSNIVSEDKYWIDYTNSPVLLITAVKGKINDDGINYIAVEGYENKKKVIRILSDVLSSDPQAKREIKPGSIIQYTTNSSDLRYAEFSQDDETIQRYVLMCDMTNTSLENFQLFDYQDIHMVNPRIRFGYATVNRYDYPYLNVDGNIFTVHDGTTVYEWNSSEKTFKKVEQGNIAEGKKVFFRVRYNNLREVVIVE